ncbi:virulence protein-like protein [Methylocaldum marinum]|uniref:Virulence protein-like protein n=1 Tax=Methylocaldum marinum TaxID=1432792 RepID=A0A250KVC3_9GAMM|nr:hypothetical protein [Methylocaldum marinum]BBA35623.1 virulence protein-like protein [Methylocaldum marinum]
MNDNKPSGEFLLYETEDGRTRVECRFADDTLWLSRALMADLFQKDDRMFNEHPQNIYEEQQLDPEATVRKFQTARQKGNRKASRNVDTSSMPFSPWATGCARCAAHSPAAGPRSVCGNIR